MAANAPGPAASRRVRAHWCRTWRGPPFENPLPVHVTLRVGAHVWNLRSRRCFRAVEVCLENAKERFGLRVIEFAAPGNHLHLIVEANSGWSLSRGMQGLAVRIAKALNRLMQRYGRVFTDHYHAVLLPDPTRLVNALACVLGNFAHHFGGQPGGDRFCSGAYRDQARTRVPARPVGWLLRAGWRRARSIPRWLPGAFGLADARVPSAHLD